MYKLLMIDDDKEVLEINQKYFTEQGFEAFIFDDVQKAIDSLNSSSYDCILLDIMMPQIDGFNACIEIRQKTSAPIIFLSGRLDENDKIKALSIGGDDYVIKPYSMKELHARILANIRRSKVGSSSENSSNILNFPPLRIDIPKHKVYFEDEPISLSNREIDVLIFLATHKNMLMTFEEIGKNVLGAYLDSDRRTVMVIMSRLRKKLDNYGLPEEMLETVWSKGYKFNYK